MPSRVAAILGALLISGTVLAAEPPARYDVIIRGGALYDGSGQPSVKSDLAITGDKVVALGDLSKAKAKLEIDARGLAVAPGFINMLSWAGEALLHDGRSQSDLRSARFDSAPSSLRSTTGTCAPVVERAKRVETARTYRRAEYMSSGRPACPYRGSRAARPASTRRSR